MPMIVPKGIGAKRKPIMTPRDYLVDNIARDTALLHKHEKENSEALKDEKHPDFYFANSKAAVISKRLCTNIAKAHSMKPGKGALELIAKYSKAQETYARNAKKYKPEGYASVGFQKMGEAVEENRKIFDTRVLRNRMLEEIRDLKGRIPKGNDTNVPYLAKLHSGIETKLLNVTSYTHALKDAGKAGVPTMEELSRQAKYHGEKSRTLKKIIVGEKREQERLKEIRKARNAN